MGRRPLKKPVPKPSKSPPRRRSSSTPQPAQGPSPPRTIPLNFILRALTTPPRPPSHHPFLRAFSTPLRRRSEYSPLVRRLCQQGAHTRLPYDNEAFVNKVLPCEGCQNTGMMTQNIAFKQGHAGEWCRNAGCNLIYYPAQPGAPPALLRQIESARETDARSSTMVTPDSRTSRSSAFFSSSPSQDINITPSIGGEFDDWLSPLFRDLDMEAMAGAHISTPSDPGTPEPVAGPSTGPGLSGVHNPPPRCARDEEIARELQSAFDEEDALLLQQLEEEPPAEASPSVSDRHEEPTTLSSLKAELATITGARPVGGGDSSAAAVSREDAPPSRSTSRESSPSPRPRKKKRIIVPPSPTPPPVKRKIYGPIPPAPTVKSRAAGKTSKGNVKSAKSGTALANAKLPPKNSVNTQAQTKPYPTLAALLGVDAPSPNIIVISSDDEHPPPANADESDIIDITSSDSGSDTPPAVTQPPAPRSVVTPRAARIPPSASQKRTPRSRAANAPPPPSPSRTLRSRAKPLTASTPPSPSPSRTLWSRAKPLTTRNPPQTSPSRTSRSRAKPLTTRTSPSPSPSRTSRSRAKPLTARVASQSTRPGAAGSRAGPRKARSPPAPPIRRAEGGDELDVINITSSESDSDAPPPATQPRTVRSRAPSREARAGTCPTRSDSESDNAPPLTQPRTARQIPDSGTPTRSLSAIGKELQDTAEAGSSNKENVTHSCLDFRVSTRLATSQTAARRQVGVFASLAQTFSSSSNPSAGDSGDGVSHVSEAADSPPRVSSPAVASTRVDASDVFGDPFRFEVYPAIPGLAANTDPTAEQRHWILTVKIWYKNNAPPSTKMIPLDRARCSIRLSNVFIVSRAFHSVGITNVRVWNRFTTDWEARTLYDYLAVSITDNHTVLIRLPTVATLSSWAENISQAYGLCQTVDPRPAPSRKGKEPAYN